MIEYARWFDQLSGEDVAIAGSEGANLDEMTQTGLPVPPGFVLLAAAYNAFIQETGLRETLAAVGVTQPEALEAVANRQEERGLVR